MDISSLQKDLTDKESQDLTRLQRELHQQFERGSAPTYLGEKFKVLPGVFPPRPDSVALVQSMNIRPGDRVLDVCCGSGVIGIIAAQRAASHVVGLDISPIAVQCANQNAKDHTLKNFEARVSDVLSALRADEQFEIVTFNPPYRDMPTSRLVECTTWDMDLAVHRSFFAHVGQHLVAGGTIYFAQANFGELRKIQGLLDEHGWHPTLVGTRPLSALPGMKFYAFRLTR